MSNKVRLGVIGCGVIGKTHVKAGVCCPDGELVAVADLLPERLSEAKTIAPNVRTYDSGAALLDDREIDGVVVALPTGLRNPLVMKAFAQGKHVLVEKPVAMSVKELEQYIAAQGSRIGACCSSRYSFLPSNGSIKAFVAAGNLGKLRLIRARGVFGAGPRPTWQLPDWRLKKALNGGGYLVNWGCYDLDFIFSSTEWKLKPQSVFATTWSLASHLSTRATPGSEAETHFAMIIRCADGMSISFERGESTTSANEHVHQFIGEKGTLRTMMVSGPKTIYHDCADSEFGLMTRTFWEGRDPDEPLYNGPLHDFASAIAKGHEPRTSLQKAMLIQKITDAVYESAANGRSVDL